MDKKEYITPSIEIVILDVEDIITTSGLFKELPGDEWTSDGSDFIKRGKKHAKKDR